MATETLYQDSRIKVVLLHDQDAYLLTLLEGAEETENISLRLEKGVLEELIAAELPELESRIRDIDYDFAFKVGKRKIPYSFIGHALAQAMANELEQQLKPLFRAVSD
ncbi:MAG: hypothetical protein NTW17_01310 [Candidatus Pacearchaeota archaeon]|nr:hypothetical protein [Candidatus Pacearchaeota archaeon]